MSLAPFPPASSVAWRRLDVPGREEAEIRLVPGGWHLSGTVDVEEAGHNAQFSYRIDVDEGWRTRSALVEGKSGARPFRLGLSADGRGNWFREGEPVPALAGALERAMTSRQERAERGRTARAFAERFRWPAIASQLQRAYASIAGSPAAAAAGQ